MWLALRLGFRVWVLGLGSLVGFPLWTNRCQELERQAKKSTPE